MADKPVRVRDAGGNVGHAYRAIAGGKVVAEPDHVFVVWQTHHISSMKGGANRLRTNELWRTRDGAYLSQCPEVTAVYGNTEIGG